MMVIDTVMQTREETSIAKEVKIKVFDHTPNVYFFFTE